MKENGNGAARRISSFILRTLFFAAAFGGCLSPNLLRAEEYSRVSHFTAGLFPRGTLFVDTRIGDVKIEGWKEPRVEIEAEKVVRAGSEAGARRLFSQLRIEVLENDEEVFLRTIYPARRPWRLFRGATRLSVNFHIRIPHQANVTLKCVDGDVTIRGVGGRQEIRVSYGNVEVTIPSIDRLRLLSARSFLGYVQSDLHGEDDAGFGRGVSFWNPGGEQEIRVRVRLGGVYVYRGQ